MCTQVLETDERRRKMPQRRWKHRGMKKRKPPQDFLVQYATTRHLILSACTRRWNVYVRSRNPESSFSIRSAACLQVRKSGNEVFLFLYSFFCLLISLTCCFSSVSFSSPFPPFFFWGFLSLDGEKERGRPNEELQLVREFAKHSV